MGIASLIPCPINVGSGTVEEWTNMSTDWPVFCTYWQDYELSNELSLNLFMRRETFSSHVKTWHLPLVLAYP